MLILLLTVAAVLVGLSLINTGILASEKMQLQNAADATAYSVSTVEARDLNFSAYTNRSMVANEVFMGQMVGLMSHADMLASIPAWWSVNFARYYGVPGVGTALSLIGGILQGLRAPEPFIRTGAAFFSGLAYEFTKSIDYSQRIFHLGTMIFTGATLFDVPGRNADDAQHSPFGYVTMGFHLLSHYADIRPQSIVPEGPFVTSYQQDDERRRPLRIPLIPRIPPGPLADKATSPAQKEGMQRLAALINAHRDPYSRHRQCGPNPPGPWQTNCVAFTTSRPDGSNATGGVQRFKFFLPIPTIDISTPPPLEIRFRFDFGVDRHGGTDLRYKVAQDTTQRYVWSASDQMAMVAQIFFRVRLCIPNIITGGWICTGPPPVDRIIDSPLGVGGAQSSIPQNEFLGVPADRTMFLDPYPPGGLVQDRSYGGNPGLLPAAWTRHNLVPWQMFAPPPLGHPGALSPALAVQTNNLYNRYEGLPRYNDSKRGPDPISFQSADLSLGWNSPYIVISLEKDLGDVAQSETRGGFRLDPNAAADKLTVLAKSEVYFSRPNDLNYFARLDGGTELANAFNPYWDARLVDTSYLDRITALAVNQQQAWLGPDVVAVLTNLENLLTTLGIL